MARTPREFGVPGFELLPENEPMGFRQTGLFPAGSINIVRQQEDARIRAAAKQYAIDRAYDAVRMNAEWDKESPYGAIVKPEQNTLRGYKRILRQGGGIRDVQFSPKDYKAFDNIVAMQGGFDRESRKFTHPAFNKEHPHYEDYAALRRNLAILRNYLFVTLLPEGKRDEKNLVKLRHMAKLLGEALAVRPPFLKRWASTVKKLVTGKDISTAETNPFLEAANIPDIGIATMYNFLFSRRETPVSPLTHPMQYLFGERWSLLPLEETPFSESNMLTYGRGTVLEGIANAFEDVVKQLNSVDTLTEGDKAISVEHARNILENLRIVVGNKLEEANVDVIADTKQAEAEMILRAAIAYKDAVAGLAKMDPNLLHDPVFMDAKDALTQLDYMMKTEAMEALYEEGRTNEANVIRSRLASMPKRPKTQPVSTLVSRIRTGYNEAIRLSSNANTRGATRSTPAKAKLNAAQQAVQATVNTFAPGARFGQVSNPSLVALLRQFNLHHMEEMKHHADELQHHSTPSATPHLDELGRPITTGQGPGRR